VYALFRRADAGDVDPAAAGITNASEEVVNLGPRPVDPDVPHTVAFARCFLRLANLPNFALDRLSRYEATLWRQLRQTLLALDALDRRKPQERRRRFPIDRRSVPPSFEDDESYKALRDETDS
jgi:hypothetical protein